MLQFEHMKGQTKYIIYKLLTPKLEDAKVDPEDSKVVMEMVS